MSDNFETGDAFGEILRAHHNGELSYEIHELADGTVSRLPGPDEYFAGSADWPAHEREALEWADGAVLDIGCGAGRHALYLQDQGHTVTGIDISAGARSVARDRGVADVRDVDVAAIDASLDRTYETALMLGNNFNLVGTRARAPDILDGIAAVTAEDGVLIAESVDPVADGETVPGGDSDEKQDPHAQQQRMRIRFGDLATEWFDVLQVGPAAMRELVADTPWAVTDRVDGPRGAYIARLEKP